VIAEPAGRDEAGLPIGVRIVGPRWSETRLLDIAAEMEEAGILPTFTRPPAIDVLRREGPPTTVTVHRLVERDPLR
jgi:hypothetical protein